MRPSRRNARRGRDSGRSGSSRRGDRDDARSRRSGSSRRGGGRESERRSTRESGRRSTRESGRLSAREERETGRYGRVQKKSDTPIIIGAVVGVVLVLALIGVAVSGGRKRRRRKSEEVPPPVRKVVSTINFYFEGRKRGSDWKRRMRNRQTAPTPTEVREVAERMTSDYANRGITPEGEERFKKGFCETALRR